MYVERGKVYMRSLMNGLECQDGGRISNKKGCESMINVWTALNINMRNCG